MGEKKLYYNMCLFVSWNLNRVDRSNQNSDIIILILKTIKLVLLLEKDEGEKGLHDNICLFVLWNLNQVSHSNQNNKIITLIFKDIK